MKKMHKTPLALAMGATLLPLSVDLAQAEINPFGLADLNSGYMQTAAAAQSDQGADTKMKDGSCGEGKCGAAMKQSASTDKKAVEGKCAGNKPAGSAADGVKKPDNAAEAGKK